MIRTFLLLIVLGNAIYCSQTYAQQVSAKQSETAPLLTTHMSKILAAKKRRYDALKKEHNQEKLPAAAAGAAAAAAAAGAHAGAQANSNADAENEPVFELHYIPPKNGETEGTFRLIPVKDSMAASVHASNAKENDSKSTDSSSEYDSADNSSESSEDEKKQSRNAKKNKNSSKAEENEDSELTESEVDEKIKQMGNVNTKSCNLCKRTFKQTQSLRRHIREKHLNIKKYACTHCPRKFKQSSHLKLHIYTHKKIKPYHCQFCDRGFVQISTCKSHELICAYK